MLKSPREPQALCADKRYGPYVPYGLPGGEWGRARVKYSNKLVRNGNSTQVTIPSRAIEWLQWRAGDPVILEVNADHSITVRQPREDDLRVAPAPGARLGLLPEFTR